jgi:hypothetical protein
MRKQNKLTTITNILASPLMVLKQWTSGQKKRDAAPVLAHSVAA